MKSLKKPIGELKKHIRECRGALATLEGALASLVEVCEHDWKVDFTDGHNGDDHYKCQICGHETKYRKDRGI